MGKTMWLQKAAARRDVSEGERSLREENHPSSMDGEGRLRKTSRTSESNVEEGPANQIAGTELAEKL
jgi:hypothetical protein